MSFKRFERSLIAAGLTVQTREAGDGTAPGSRLSGYASVFNEWTTLYDSRSLLVREVIRPGAFRAAIDSGQDVRALVDHDSSLLLGRTRSKTLRLVEDEKGLRFDLDLPDTQTARDLVENIRLGNVDQCSFAFVPRSGGQTVTTRSVDGKTLRDVEVTSVDLYDVSVVTYPAYSGTSVALTSRNREFVRIVDGEWLAGVGAKIDALAASV